MQLTCPTCGARYQIADGTIASGGQHVQCTSCHARWFEGPADPESDGRFREDEIIARLDRRTGATGSRPRAARRSPPSGTGLTEGTEFRWEGRPDATAGPTPAARRQPGHLRLVAGDAGADEEILPASGIASSPMPAAAPPDAPAATPAAGGRDDAPVSRPMAAGGVPQPGVRDLMRLQGAGGASRDHGEAEGAVPPRADLRPAQPVRPAVPGSRSEGLRPPARPAETSRLDLGATAPTEPALPRRRRWTGGLFVGLALVVLLIALYLAAEPVAGILPWAAEPIAAYASATDTVRLHGGAQFATFAESLRGGRLDGD
jgi:predicted Zn finger-like uncharacterized protein